MNKRSMMGLVGCLLVCMTVCFGYLAYRTPLYGAFATVLFQDGSQAQVAGGKLLFREVAGSREVNRLNPDNELLILSYSFSLFHTTVMRTGVNVSSHVRGLLGKHFFDKEGPVRLRSYSKRMALPFSFRVEKWNETGFHIVGEDWERTGRWMEPVVTPAGDSLVLASGPEMDRWAGRTVYFMIEDPYQTAMVFRRRMGFSQPKYTQGAHLSQLSPHPGMSARFLKELLASYEESHHAHYEELLDSTRCLLDRQIASTEVELRQMEAEEWGFKEKRRAANLALQGQQGLKTLIGVERLGEEARMRQQVLERFLAELPDEGELPHSVALLPGNDGVLVNRAILEYNRQRLRLTRLREQASAGHPRVAALESVLRAHLGSIRRRVGDLAQAALTEAMVNGRRKEEREEEIRAIASTESGVAPLTRERRIRGTLYSYFSYKREENDLLRTQVSPPMRILSAVQSAGLSSPSAARVLFYGVMIALAGWIGWMVAMRYLDFSVGSSGAIRKLTGMPVLGEVPETVDENLRGDAFAALAYDLLRDIEPIGGGMVCVTSTTPGEGKTFVSVNLAGALAKLGKRVCVVGLDLRRPMMQAHFGMEQARGVSDLLSAPERFEPESLFRYPENMAGLSVLPAGTVPPNPAELLQSERFDKLLRELRDRFDVIVLDTPPAEIVADTALVARHVDRALYVVRCGVTDRRLLPMAKELIDSGCLPSVRVVVNSARMKC